MLRDHNICACLDLDRYWKSDPTDCWRNHVAGDDGLRQLSGLRSPYRRVFTHPRRREMLKAQAAVPSAAVVDSIFAIRRATVSRYLRPEELTSISSRRQRPKLVPAVVAGRTLPHILLASEFSPSLPPSARQHPSYGDCLEVKREYYQKCSVLGCVTQCSQSAAHSCEQFLQVQQIGFVTLGPLRHA